MCNPTISPLTSIPDYHEMELDRDRATTSFSSSSSSVGIPYNSYMNSNEDIPTNITSTSETTTRRNKNNRHASFSSLFGLPMKYGGSSPQQHLPQNSNTNSNNSNNSNNNNFSFFLQPKPEKRVLGHKCTYISELPIGAHLKKGEFLCSPSRNYQFGLTPTTSFQRKENSILQKSLLSFWRNSKLIWNVDYKDHYDHEEINAETEVMHVTLQRDGNLVVYGKKPSNKKFALWATNTHRVNNNNNDNKKQGSTKKRLISKAEESQSLQQQTTSQTSQQPRNSKQSRKGSYLRKPKPTSSSTTTKTTSTQSRVRLILKDSGIIQLQREEEDMLSHDTLKKEIIWKQFHNELCTDDTIPLDYINSTNFPKPKEIIDSTTLHHKIMAGYQGWFAAQHDGGVNKWKHWSRKSFVPDADTISFEMWPDLREYSSDELYDSNFLNKGLYSAYNYNTVERHVKWMEQYGIQGVFVQRFIHEATTKPCVRDKIINNIRYASQKYGRVFANMYDISDGKDDTLVQDIKNDWMHLVDDVRILESDRYLHHKGKPLLAIWGFGFLKRPGTAEQAKELIQWFQHDAPPKYQVTLMGGVPKGWREENDGEWSKEEGWGEVYKQFNVISPWTVGRLKDEKDVDKYRTKYLEKDLKECAKLGVDYLPVVFPGYSMSNLKQNNKFNEVPRNGGTFLWHQLHNVFTAGSQMAYVAMFDEVDEGTAIYKIAETLKEAPSNISEKKQPKFLTLDADKQNGYDCVPSDWYLKLVGNATRFLVDGDAKNEFPQQMPALPACRSNKNHTTEIEKKSKSMKHLTQQEQVSDTQKPTKKKSDDKKEKEDTTTIKPSSTTTKKKEKEDTTTVKTK